MITIAILEQNSKNVEKIKEMLAGYAIRKNLDISTLWFSTRSSLQKLEKYVSKIHIAMISLEKSTGLREGMEIYSNNPECRILYYSFHPCELQPLFHSRPIEYHFWVGNDEEMLEKLDMVVNELMCSNAVFCYRTRKKLLLIPERNISYLRSNLKKVEIHQWNGETEILFAKLSEVEKKLSGRFVRVHQSFIVHVDSIISIGWDTHMLMLKNGECIPISEARYQDSITRIKELSANRQF